MVITGKYFQGADLCAVFCTAPLTEKHVAPASLEVQRLDNLQPPRSGVPGGAFLCFSSAGNKRWLDFARHDNPMAGSSQHRSPEPASTPCQPVGTGIICFCSVVLPASFPTQWFCCVYVDVCFAATWFEYPLRLCAWLRQQSSRRLERFSNRHLPNVTRNKRWLDFARHDNHTRRSAREAFCLWGMHLYWCNCGSILSSGNSSGLKIYIDSPICCAVENRPQEIVFSLLTLLVRDAKVSSTCAAVPFGEVRSHSRVPVLSRMAMFGRTSQPLAMLWAVPFQPHRICRSTRRPNRAKSGLWRPLQFDPAKAQSRCAWPDSNGRRIDSDDPFVSTPAAAGASTQGVELA